MARSRTPGSRACVESNSKDSPFTLARYWLFDRSSYAPWMVFSQEHALVRGTAALV